MFSQTLTKLLILILSLLAIFVIFKSLKIYSTITLKYWVYLIFFLTLIFVFSTILNYKKNIINETLIVFFSILFSLYLIQSFITYKSLNKIWSFNKKGNFKYDIRAYSEVLKSEDFFPKISTDYFMEDKTEIFPIGTISNKKILACNENGYYSHYISDRYGFNNPDQNWDKKKIDYLILGDSYMEGDCVYYKDTLMGNLKNLNIEKNIISLGRGGTGTLFQYAALKEYSKNKNVINVLLFYYEGNDLGNIKNEMNFKVLTNYLKDDYSQNLIHKQKLVNKIILSKVKELDIYGKSNQFYIEEISRFIKLAGIRDTIRYFINFFRNKHKNDIKQFSYILGEINKFCINNNMNLNIIYIPSYARYRGNIEKHEDFLKYNEVKDLIKNKNINFLDFAKHLRKQIQPLENWPFKNHGHLNEKGYRELSKFVYNSLNE